MTNVQYEVKGDILTIKVDLSKRNGKSASGKTTVIASTQGNVPIGHASGASMGLNVYTKGE
jgi:hypothetical protein